QPGLSYLYQAMSANVGGVPFPPSNIAGAETPALTAPQPSGEIKGGTTVTSPLISPSGEEETRDEMTITLSRVGKKLAKGFWHGLSEVSALAIWLKYKCPHGE
nr:hypothetical protein [Planctomycetota bacterium]